MKSVWGIVLACMGTVAGFCEGLWVIEQDMVKFGKQEAYEGYKKGSGGFAFKVASEAEYIYLMPVNDYVGLDSFMRERKELNDKDLQAYSSTINFTVQTLQQYIPACSFILKGKEDLGAYPAVYFYVFGIVPGNEATFEGRLNKIAGRRKATMRTWKVLFGAEIPKYVVAVFAESEEEAKKQAEGLKIISGSWKNLVRSQRVGSAQLLNSGE